MVFESLITPVQSEKKPYFLFLIGFGNTALALLLSKWIFNNLGGIISIFFTTLLLHILVFRTMQLEEYKSLFYSKEMARLNEHVKALRFLLFLFFGSTVAYAVFYFFFPEPFFRFQINAFQNAELITKIFTSNSSFLITILFNNYKLLLLVLLLSFISCSGGLFILIWNASVIGITLATLIEQQITVTTSFPVLSAISFGIANFLHIFLHGALEIAAYFLIGIAGSMISVALIHKHYHNRSFYRILFDVADLILISVFLIFIAGIIEVYISPMIPLLI